MTEIAELFSYSSYRNYLHETLELRSVELKGVRSRLAEAIGCQPGYLSRILAGTADLSLEQADLASRFFGHVEEERRFFLMLVERERAGTPRLRAFFDKELDSMRRARLDLKTRFKTEVEMTPEQQAHYFSHWYYAGIHAAVSVPDLSSRAALARALGLSSERVREGVEFLLQTGLIREVGGKLEVGTTRLHLGNDSVLVARHHANWRMQALQALERDQPDHLHYSSVVTISRDDYLKIKSELVRALESAKQTIRASKDEEVCCLNLDWFPVGRG